MMRFLVNAAGSVLLAFALVFAVADIARSMAGDIVRLTSLGQVLALVGVSLEPVAGQSEAAKALIGAVAAWPASVMLGIAAFLLLFIGRPRRAARARFTR